MAKSMTGTKGKKKRAVRPTRVSMTVAAVMDVQRTVVAASVEISRALGMVSTVQDEAMAAGNRMRIVQERTQAALKMLDRLTHRRKAKRKSMLAPGWSPDRLS